MKLLSKIYINVKRILASALTSPCVAKTIFSVYKGPIPFRTLVFDTNIPEVSPITKAEILFRIYERAEIRFIKKYLPHSLDVIELGSSIGVVSVIIRKQLAQMSRLLCVEAHPALSKQTIKNLQLNKLYNNVKCVNAAVSHNKDVFLNPGELSTTGKVTSTRKKENYIPITTVTLSELKLAFAINDFTLVMDIEGGEIFILREDKKALQTCKHLFIELHDTIYKEVLVTVEDMVRELIHIHGFFLQDRYDNVCYLTRIQ